MNIKQATTDEQILSSIPEHEKRKRLFRNWSSPLGSVLRTRRQTNL